MLEIEMVSRDVYITRIDDTEYEWTRYSDYPLAHIFANIVKLERVFNGGCKMCGYEEDMLRIAVTTAHCIMCGG